MPDTSLHSRRLSACLIISRTYFMLALFFLALLLAAHFLGVELLHWQLDALWVALGIHGLGALGLSGLIAVAHRSSRIKRWHGKVALAAMPFLFVLSLDRIAAVSFSPTPKKASCKPTHCAVGPVDPAGLSGAAIGSFGSTTRDCAGRKSRMTNSLTNSELSSSVIRSPTESEWITAKSSWNRWGDLRNGAPVCRG